MEKYNQSMVKNVRMGKLTWGNQEITISFTWQMVKTKVIRDYVVLTPQVIQLGIIRLEVQTANFKLKPVIFQMLQIVGQFKKLLLEDPHLHFKLFFKVSNAFKIAGASQ